MTELIKENKSKRKTTVTILLILVIITGIGAVGFFLIINDEDTSSEVNTNIQSATTVSNINQPSTTNDASNNTNINDAGELSTTYLYLYKASTDIDCANLETNLLPRSIKDNSSIEAMALEITSYLFEDLDPTEFQNFNKSYVNYPEVIMDITKSKLLAATLDTSLFGEDPFIQVHVKDITVVDGTATVDMPIYFFAQEGNCNAWKFESTVINTLKQFDDINEVVVTVEGEEMWCDTDNCVNQRIFDLTKSSEFTVTAKPGDGVTHLTRSALDTFDQECSRQLPARE
jgi:hypothetical protein